MSEINNNFLRDLKFTNDFVPTSTKDLMQVTGVENAKQAIFNRIITTKGSVIHRPNYGFGLKRWVEGLSSLSIQQDFALQIKEEVEKDFRVSEVQTVQIENEDGGPVFIISLKILLVGGNLATLEIEANGDEDTITRRI